jgi:FkbM family methyltransferase
MEEGRVVDAASRHGNPQAREPQDAAQPEPHQDPQDKEEDSVDPDHSPGEPEPDAANPEEDGVDPDHSPKEPDRDAADPEVDGVGPDHSPEEPDPDAADPEPAAAPVAPSKLDVDSLLQAIDRLTPAKRKSLLEALPLPPAPVVSDVESVLQAIDQLTPAKRKTLYEALPESPADARAPSKSDVEGALQAIAELSPPKQLAVYEALALPEVELGEGITVTARSRKEFRRLGRGIDATRLGWLGGLSAGDVLYDVGANCGSLTLAAAAMHGPDVRIVAVEPGYANFESLARNLSCNDMLGFVIPLQVALLDRSGLAPMRYHTATAAGRYRHAVGRHLDFLDDEFTPVATQTVPVFSLDSLLDLLGLPEPTHVKIGVDGTEERVLEGAVATLAGGAVSQLMIEIIDHDEAHSRLASVQRLLDGHGYELAETFWHHPEAERRYVADHLFTRR